MPGTNASAGDEMIRRLERELDEKDTFARGIAERANASNRDLSEEEKGLLAETRSRMENIKGQLEQLEDINRVAYESRNRAREVGNAIETMRGKPQVGTVEYRSAGEWALDTYKSHLGDRDATEKLEMYYRAAAHQKTSDNLGVVPDPIVGDVVNFIDAARPLVSALGPRPLPSSTWHRPVVTQHTAVAVQGSAGAAADEKTELVSQKMTIGRLTANAVTYGGYVNVSRQNIDFSQPSVMDIIINDLAAQYAIETEQATATALAATATSAVTYDLTPAAGTVADAITGAIWDAVAVVYAAVKGQGRLLLVVAPDVLGNFGPVFAPINPQNAQSTGFTAGSFAQGVMGTIAGVPVLMSAGLDSGDAFLLSTAAIEVYEQRVGTLQITEPSVLGVQVAYAGYFTPLTILDDAIVPLTSA
jgi:HK97 family phage major capsid protein